MALKFRCEHCNMMLMVSYLDKGAKTQCSHCGKEITIPENAVSVNSDEAVFAAEQHSDPKLIEALKIETKIKRGATTAKILKALGWISLILGGIWLIIAIIYAITQSNRHYSSDLAIANFSGAFQSIFGSIIFLGVGYILEHIIAMRRRLEGVIESEGKV